MSPSAPEADKEGFVPRRSRRDLRGYVTHQVRPSAYRRPRAMSVIGRREHISI
ncbi:hypothetical protein L226DRAFT_531420 [Lentinus tigrinus ALCF2SS1-7]|uniref:uncharacterized protein n=1 Tax=Lentinus tigrinus ALCF2SS1-7 TaxID=1328758 RepID=UPI00116601D7|nr:hypothetical protein L226DRAFT_531420 [Lentinus tigrinus ALCF2SS1-7]